MYTFVLNLLPFYRFSNCFWYFQKNIYINSIQKEILKVGMHKHFWVRCQKLTVMTAKIQKPNVTLQKHYVFQLLFFFYFFKEYIHELYMLLTKLFYTGTEL